jgi:two-component sensor histidine kinase
MIPAPYTQVGNAPATAMLTRRVWPFWHHYWPVISIGVGMVWLTVSIVAIPLNEWFTALAKFQNMAKHTGSEPFWDDLMRGWNARGRGEPPPDMSGISLYWQLAWSIFIPLTLIHLGTGYYIYWHFSRKTLFDKQLSNRLIFVAAFSSSWIIWLALANTTLYISPATSKAGFDSVLPTLTMGFWIMQSLVMHLSVRQNEDRLLAQATREAELAALTAQVNPPFIFHALQQLQASAHTEHLPRTEQSLAQLAGIMQYVLEESRKQITDVSREIDFIRDYLRLQELRLPQRETIQITTDVVWDGKPAPIVPLLLNPLIENAFKYGISMQQPCFVRIQLHVADGVLTFRSENSILPRTDLEKGTGLGLANVRKRLQLAYPKLHKIATTETANAYTVLLNIKLC